ncbi:MAG: translation initiation factor IF-3 [Thermoflavifilum sp.]|nr:translation initiation factor IF-3 [Thermoflavifilum sp.]
MQKRTSSPSPRKKDTGEFRINRMIRAKEVRVVGENIETGIYPIEEALRMAEEQGLDLVEISPNANPPVCKIIDYNKFLYERKKKEKEIKAKSAKSEVKELRFTPNTDDHDFEFKLRHAEKFLKEGNKVKAYVQFKGRAIMFKERGELILLKLAERLAEVGVLEGMPKLEGRRMHAIIVPKSTKKKS